MTLPELSVKRHVLAWMVNAVLVLFGVIAFTRIGMDRLPYIEFPVVSVTTALKGANPDIVDSSVTNLIEGAVNSVPGIEHIQSTSSPGVSVVNITFGLEKDVDVAFTEVQSKVNQVLRRLPKDVDPPVVAKVETNASPIFWMAVQGNRTQQQLNQYALNVIKKKLETIDGVGEVRLGGRRDRTIRVNLLPDRMTALGVSAQDISDAFAREHVQLAGGFVVGETTEHLVKLDLEFHTLDALGGLVVGYRGTPPSAAPIRLADIAELGRRPHRQPAAGALQRRNHDRHGRGQGDQRQYRRHRRTHQGKAGQRNRAATAAGDEDQHRLQRCRVHPRNRQLAQGTPARRHAAGLARGLVLPALTTLDADRRPGDPGLADGRHRRDLLLRLHAQLADHAGAAAADRRRRRRCDRGAGEHLPPPRGD
jgi:hypothetical protein